MKKVIAALLFSSICIPALRAQQKAGLSAPTLQYLSRAKKAGPGSFVPDYVYKIINGKKYISGMIQVSPAVDQSALDALGVFVGTHAGNIWTVQVPLDKVEAFTQVAGIRYIDVDLPIIPTLDSARKMTRADSAHKGIYLPMPFTGKNVVAGIIDAGFDYNHTTFYDTGRGHYRIKRVWNQKTMGTPPAGYAYGQEITDTNTMKAVGYDTTITSHGSHVAGIMAGSGVDGGVGGKYRGFAYESDIVMVGIMPSPLQWINTGVSDVVDGMNYIYSYASSVGKPAVVNLSWGSTLGPHDGNSLFSQAADFLTGAGHIFVCAAGNNAQDTVHLQKTFTLTDTIIHTFVNFSPYLDTAHKNTYVDVWGDTGASYCMNIRLYNGASAIDSTGWVCVSATGSHDFNLIGSNGDTCMVTITTVPTEYNGKPHAYIYLHSKVHDNICLSTRGYGLIDMWEGYVMPPTGYYGTLSSNGYSWARSGDAEYTVSDIGSTRSAITVAAYNTKPRFTNISGSTLTFTGATRGRLAPFSSHGPTADGRVKPDIAAPGFGVVSSISSYDPSFLPAGADYDNLIQSHTDAATSRNYGYAILAGTSMASPCASGIVAMMLQQNPSLTPDEAKNIINTTAIKDTFTSTVLPPAGNNLWGHGKINAYKALRYMVGNLAVDNKDIDAMDCVLYPNPGHGNFTLSYTGKTADKLDICVYDITGRMVYCNTWSVQPGTTQRDLDLATLPKGTYLTKVSSLTGHTTIKTVIQ